MISRMFEPSLPTKISILTLDYNNFGNEGLSQLMDYVKNNKTIKYLSLAYCGIDEKGIGQLDSYLNETPTLETLILQGNPLKNAGVKELLPFLTNNKSISEINLNNVLFGNDAEVIADLSNLMVNNQTLEVYYLKFNFITDQDYEVLLKTLKESCPHICTLSVDEKIKKELFEDGLKTVKGRKKGGKKGKKGGGKKK